VSQRIGRFLEMARSNADAAELLNAQGYEVIAASRAYYALFYVAIALLESRGLAYSKHSAVVAAYGKEFAKTRRLDPKFHQYLRSAFALRQKTDYTPEPACTRNDASEVISWAREFIDAATSYLGPLAAGTDV